MGEEVGVPTGWVGRADLAFGVGDLDDAVWLELGIPAGAVQQMVVPAAEEGQVG